MIVAEKATNDRRDWCAVLFALAFPTLVTVVYFMLLAGQPALVQQGAYGIGKFIQFLFPAIWVVCVQRAKPSRPQPKQSDFLIGAGIGLALSGLALAAYHFYLKPAGFFAAAEGPVRQKIEGIGVGSTGAYLAVALFYSLLHSLLEEYYWRWFVFGQLRRLASAPAAIGLSSLGFMAHHVCIVSTYFGWFSPASIVLSLAVAAGGAMWAWVYERTGSLFGPWISHALVDAAIFIVGYDLVMSPD